MAVPIGLAQWGDEREIDAPRGVIYGLAQSPAGRSQQQTMVQHPSWSERLSAVWRRLSTRHAPRHGGADDSPDSIGSLSFDSRLAGTTAPSDTGDGFSTFAEDVARKGRPYAQVQRKLELARSYIDLGIKPGARELLLEVLRDGAPEQRRAAASMLDDVLDS